MGLYQGSVISDTYQVPPLRNHMESTDPLKESQGSETSEFWTGKSNLKKPNKTKKINREYGGWGRGQTDRKWGWQETQQHSVCLRGFHCAAGEHPGGCSQGPTWMWLSGHGPRSLAPQFSVPPQTPVLQNSNPGSGGSEPHPYLGDFLASAWCK